VDIEQYSGQNLLRKQYIIQQPIHLRFTNLNKILNLEPNQGKCQKHKPRVHMLIRELKGNREKELGFGFF